MTLGKGAVGIECSDLAIEIGSSFPRHRSESEQRGTIAHGAPTRGTEAWQEWPGDPRGWPDDDRAIVIWYGPVRIPDDE